MSTRVAERDVVDVTAEPGNLPALSDAAALTPMVMLDRAVASGAGIETLDRLMALQERWDKNQARKAFDAAIAAAKAEIPVIRKNRRVGFESKRQGAARTDYAHEDMAEIARTVDPILSRHGLSYRFRATSNINEPVTVTCIVSHRLGHSEENTLCAGRDESGNKNSIQAVGSTVTYLQRYTLKAALGLAAAEDDDGKAAGGGPDPNDPISEEQLAALQTKIVNVGIDISKVCAFAHVEKLNEITVGKLDRVIAGIDQWATRAAAPKGVKA